MTRTTDQLPTSGALRAVRAIAVATKSMAAKVTGIRFPGYGGGSTAGLGGAGRGWFRFLLPGSAGYDYEAEAGPLWHNSAVAVCVGWIRKNFPEPRLTVEVRQGTEWVENPEHPFLESLAEPNPAYTDDVLWAASCLSIVVDGNAYWYKAKAPGGKVHYWYLPHWTVFPCWPADGSEFISHYEYRVDGKTTVVPVDRIVHFRTGLDPFDERRGWSELKTCLREICTDNEANTYTVSILKNMGIVGLLITPESDTDEISPEDAEDLKRNFKSKTTGSRRGEPIVNTVPLKVTEVGATPEKLALDKIRRVPESRICAAIGLDPMVVGLSTGKEGRTFSNLGESNRHAYQNCLIPMQKGMAKDLQRQSRDLIKGPRVERLVWKYDEVEALREDQSELMKRIVVACGGPVMTVTEGRARVGLKPTGDPEHDKVRAASEPNTAPAIGGNKMESEKR